MPALLVYHVHTQGLTKMLSYRLGQLDSPSGQEAFHSHLHDGKKSGKLSGN